MAVVDKYGTLGMFGEDGIESLHPWDNRCRVLTRSMRNPVQRAKARTLHLQAKQFGGRGEEPKKKRTAAEYAAHTAAQRARGVAKRARHGGAATPLPGALEPAATALVTPSPANGCVLTPLPGAGGAMDVAADGN